MLLKNSNYFPSLEFTHIDKTESEIKDELLTLMLSISDLSDVKNKVRDILNKLLFEPNNIQEKNITNDELFFLESLILNYLNINSIVGIDLFFLKSLLSVMKKKQRINKRMT